MAKYGEVGYHTETLANGTEVKFKFQHLGTRETIKFIARTEDDPEKRLDDLLANVIRFDTDEPSKARVTWEWFDEQEDGFMLANKIGNAAFGFLVGIRKEQTEAE